MTPEDKKQHMLAKLLGYANASFHEVNNQINPNDSGKIPLEGIDRREFVEAVSDIGKYKSNSYVPPSSRVYPDVDVGPGDPNTARGVDPFRHAAITDDQLQSILTSIDATLKSILDIMMTITGVGSKIDQSPAPPSPPPHPQKQ